MTTLMTQASPTSSIAIDRARVVIRALDPGDSIDELTAVLHRAYKEQIDMGLHPLAGRQSPEITRTRTGSGECFVAVHERRLLGTILLQEIEDAPFPPHFRDPQVAHFSLLGVEPEAQGLGIGRRLLEAVEDRARGLGFTELACSMAKPDVALMHFYERLGYRLVDHWRWPYTNYRSAILSKPIA